MKIKGITKNENGYLRIKRGKLRDQLAHRAYAARQMGVDKLPPEIEVHHECRNRACWPPTDWHLVIVSAVLTPYMFQTHANGHIKRRHVRRKKK